MAEMSEKRDDKRRRRREGGDDGEVRERKEIEERSLKEKRAKSAGGSN